MATVTDKGKCLSVEGKVKVIRQIENGEKMMSVLGIWSRKFYDPNDLKKQNQNY
jgi:hypothetical protein